MRIALINTNRIKPPIAPIGLEYVAEAMADNGYTPEILDLCWAEDWIARLTAFFTRNSFDLVGFTLRNTDDCAFGSRQSFIKEFNIMVKTVRNLSEAFIVIGGIGFSIMYRDVMAGCDADAGMVGDGEFAFPSLASRIEKGEDWYDIPGLVFFKKGKWQQNLPEPYSLDRLPKQSRSWFDNKLYFNHGGQGGIETKRGCSGHCIYCPEPAAKGSAVRVRPPEDVVFEIKKLYELGIDHLHTCDSEFNIPEWHAFSVCQKIIESGMGEKLRWYAYCSPVPFSRELAFTMRRAGCVGINFGVDSGDARMLKRLGRCFTPEEIIRTVSFCREAGITTMLDLLFGAPGETEESIKNTIALVRKTGAERIGISAGVRVYPGTTISGMISEGTLNEGLIISEQGKNLYENETLNVQVEGKDTSENEGLNAHGQGKDTFESTGLTGIIQVKDHSEPLFFIEPSLGYRMFDLLDQLIGNDERFFFFDPKKPQQNYNYNANQRLTDAIADGFRGAYWDILRRLSYTNS